MEVRNIAVIGAGQMGSGIAQVSAEAGYQVMLNDVSEGSLARAMTGITKSLDRGIEKGKLDIDSRNQVLARIQTTVDMTRAAMDADLVIEAVFEDLKLKREVFAAVDDVAPKHALFGTNTSSLPVAAIAGITCRQEKFVGIHFMNPVPLMKGVELIRGRHTSDETMGVALNYIASLRKEAAIAVDYAGFIVSRVLDAMLNEAVKCVMDGNDPAQIDRAMKICCNFPMGPLELIDMVGAEIVLNGLETMKGDFGDKYSPAPLLKQMVRSGDLGRKSGRGFFIY